MAGVARRACRRVAAVGCGSHLPRGRFQPRLLGGGGGGGLNELRDGELGLVRDGVGVGEDDGHRAVEQAVGGQVQVEGEDVVEEGVAVAVEVDALEEEDGRPGEGLARDEADACGRDRRGRRRELRQRAGVGGAERARHLFPHADVQRIPVHFGAQAHERADDGIPPLEQCAVREQRWLKRVGSSPQCSALSPMLRFLK